MHRMTLGALALLAACSSSPTGTSGASLTPGNYIVTDVGGNGGNNAFFGMQISAVTSNTVTFSWTSGDVQGPLPLAETADWNVDAYYILWTDTSGRLQSLRFTASSCSGMFVDPVNGSRAWSDCRIARQ